MLPIGNRPIVDYVVQDSIAAGVTDIYFVVSEQSTQLHDYYGKNEDLEDYLVRNGKEAMLPLVNAPDVNFHYVVQPSYGKYGTAVPVALAAEVAGIDEPVVVLMGDDVIYNADGSSEVARLIESVSDGESGMLGVEVGEDELSKYGVLEMNERHEFVRIVEKPSPESAPSRLINVSKYVLTPTMLRAIQAYVADEHAGEYYITDPINAVVESGEVMKVVPAKGHYLDGGTVEGWLRANQIVLNGTGLK